LTPEWQRDTTRAGQDDQMADTHEAKDPAPKKEPCMRCGAPVEHEQDMLCRKCEGEIH
jgi:ribosomal protein L40E